MLRTFSKAYGLAGLRIGWLYGPADIVAVLDRLRPPTNIAGAAQAAAAAAADDAAHLGAVVAANTATRSRFARSAAQLGLVPAPSEGNFVLVRFPDETRSSGAAYALLRSRGIIARRVDPYGLPEYLRFTMGTAAEISAALDALADFLA
jgi:histidinol-phosphate aminotransferase